MEITIFAKKRTTADNKTFTSYLTRLNKKDGEQDTVQVRFKEDCGAPKLEECPMNIVVNRDDVNLVTKDYVKADGQTGVSRTLWVAKWDKGSEYVDHSLDDYEF